MQQLFPTLDIRNDETDIPLTRCPQRGEHCNAWFTDYETIQAAPHQHWERRRVPHVFTLPTTDEKIITPDGWSLVVQEFRHSDLGGSTVGTYRLGLLVPMETYHAHASIPPLPRQPWASIATVINDVEFAEHPTSEMLAQVLAAPPIPREGAPVVKFGAVLDSRGLAPRDVANVPVAVGCVFNPSNLGIRPLTLFELGALQDVPILFLDYLRLRCGMEGRDLLKLLIQGHPSKVLFLGSDFLLSAYVRGGGAIASASAGGATASAGAGASPHVSINSEATGSKAGIVAGRIGVKTSWIEETSEDLFVEREVAQMDIERTEWNKDDDSPIHFHIWDEMFLRSWKKPQEERSVGEKWNGASDQVDILPCKDPRDCNFSDAQLTVKMSLPRWRWALMKIRAGALRYWRRKMTRDFLAYIRDEYVSHRVDSERPISWVQASLKRRKLAGETRTVLCYDWTEEGRDHYLKNWKRVRAIRGRPEVESSWSVGRDCIRRTANSLWWDWAEGSALLFWRWPASHMDWAREGQPHFVSGLLPKFKRSQRAAPTQDMMTQMQKKVNKVRKRRYIEEGKVISLTHMFPVPKGLSDIRMVYNGTSSGLNAALFAPHFGLPTLFNTMRSLLGGYYQADLDVAEMFLCFNLHPEMRPYAGVDVRLIRTAARSDQEPWEENRTRSYERWSRNFMGMRDSPYRSMQMMLMAKYLAYGDRNDPTNPFRWEHVVLNLPGSEGYDPSLPWVMKVRSDGHLACEIYVYVDDGRITGWSKLECWRAAQRLSAVLSSLGIQDAYRKRTPPTRGQKKPYPWVGGVSLTCWSDEEDPDKVVRGVAISVTTVKWAKMQTLVEELSEMIGIAAGAMDRGRLEEIRGFLIYTARTYRWMNPYLKGLHLTIDGWRPDRDVDGYRIRSKVETSKDMANTEEEDEVSSFRVNEAAIRSAEKDMEAGKDVDLKAFVMKNNEVKSGVVNPPAKVKAVPRLEGDIETLQDFLKGTEPAVQRCRVSNVAVAVYLMGDASGVGFGSALWDAEGIDYEAGNWKEQWKFESSNFREAANLTTRIEKLGAEGRLNDVELFVFTDNSSYEGTFYKGHSKTSPKLTELVRRLRMVERRYGCILHVIHIAGSRMKFSGVDGLSRGDFLEGIMAGMNPWEAIPLNKGADERTQGRVEEWVRTWWSDKHGTAWSQVGGDSSKHESSQLIKLNPEDWFRLRDIRGHRLWIPPPAAMETIVEVFNEDRIVYPHLAHVFVVPRLMTHLWRKQLFKDADVVFYVKAGAPFWPSSMHEPLTVIIVLPLAYVQNYRGPWIVKHTASAGEFNRRMDFEFGKPRERGRKEFLDLEEPMPSLWEDDYRWTRDFLFEFLKGQSQFPPVQSGLSKMEEEEEGEDGFEYEEKRGKQFMCGRHGDHLMGLPFECDVCHFRNVARRDVDWESTRDEYTLVCIRAANLDAMWSRETDTVEQNFSRIKRDLTDALPRLSLSLDSLLPEMGNPEMKDKVGMGLALITLHSSLRPGRNAETIQWDTMRKTPGWFFHVWEATTGGEEVSIFAADNKKMYETDCITRSRWFTAFLLGAKKRMGVIRKQNEALSSQQLLVLLEIAEARWRELPEGPEKKRLEEVAAFVCIGFSASLRGEEISLTSIQGMIEYWESSMRYRIPHVMVTLRGRYKGEHNLRWHMQPIAEITRSGIDNRRWISRLMYTRVKIEGAKEGPLFAKPDGTRVTLDVYDNDFRELLGSARKKSPDVFPPKASLEDYSLRRSLRRGATTEATNNKVPENTINLVNRWRKMEGAKGAQPGLAMNQVYTDALAAVETTLRYSQSL